MIKLHKRYIAWWKGMQKFIDAGGHLYFVSEYQQKFHDGHVKRITGSSLKGVKGTIHSGFADGNEVVPEKTFYDAVTIGRTDLTKNPYGKKNFFFKDATQKSAPLVLFGIALELEPTEPIFEKCPHLRD
jgi:hypothetical protein